MGSTSALQARTHSRPGPGAPTPPPARRRPARPTLGRRRLLLGLALVAAAWAAPRALIGPHPEVIFRQINGDVSWHVLNAHHIYKLLALPAAQQHDPFLREHPELRRDYFDARYPPGFYLFSALPVALVDPLSNRLPLVVNLGAFILLAAALWGLGRRLGEPESGLWAAALCALNPALLFTSLVFSPAPLLTAVVTLALLLLWDTRGFTRVERSVRFAMVAGLGLAVKVAFPIDLLGPSLVALHRGLRRRPGRGRALLVCLGAVVLTCALYLGMVLAVRGAPNTHFLRTALQEHLLNEGLPTALPAWTLAGLLAVPVMALVGLGPAGLLALAPGLVALHRKGGPAGRGYLVALLWGSLVLLTLITGKLERYVQPIYPVMILAGVHWAYRRTHRWQRRVALGGMLAANVAHIFFPGYTLFPVDSGSLDEPRETALRKLMNLKLYEARRPGKSCPREVPPGKGPGTAHCDLTGLRRGLRQLSRATASRRPVAVMMVRCPVRDYLSRALSPNDEVVTNYCASVTPEVLTYLPLEAYPDRFVFSAMFPDRLNPLMATLLHAPELVLIHPPFVRLDVIFPGFAPRHQQPAVYSCGHGRVEVVISQGTWQPPDPGAPARALTGRLPAP